MGHGLECAWIPEMVRFVPGEWWVKNKRKNKRKNKSKKNKKRKVLLE
jgi:hypothetical protein